MKRLFLIALCLWPSLAHAAGWMLLAQPYSGPGNAAPNATVWYGLRAYSRATAGTKAANICNSGDVACVDITTSPNGDFNVGTTQGAPLNCGSSGGTCTIKTLYDQIGTGCSGGPCNVTNATIANRPTLTFNCTATNKPCATFTASSSQIMTSPVLTTVSQPFSISMVSKNTLSGNWGDIVKMSASTQWEFGYLCCGGNVVRLQSGGGSLDATATDGNWYAFQVSNNIFPNVSTTVNGTITTGSINDGNGLAGTISIGGGGAGFMTGTLTEIGIWPYQLTPTVSYALSQNQGRYYGIAIAAAVASVPPWQAAGFNTVTLFDDFNSTATIDITNSQAPGFNWYLANWFVAGATSTPADNFSVSNSILTIGNGSGGAFPGMVTAFDTGVVNAYKGTVYSGGGYFEVRMKFNPALSGGSAGGVPNFYGMSIEHIADNNSVSLGQWPGQVSGYAHFFELDFFEPLGGSTTTYQTSIHDWGGIYSGGNYPQNITNGGNNIPQVGSIDFTQFHTYGALWVTQNGATPGRIERYFDDILISSIYYLGPPGSPPLPNTAGSFTPTTPGAADRTYSVLDGHHLALLLGGGLTWPIQVDWVRVRQSP